MTFRPVALRFLAAAVAALSILPMAGAIAAGPPAVIFDTDIGSDCDDAGALAVLHALADAGELKILGVIFSSGKNRFGVGTCRWVNTRAPTSAIQAIPTRGRHRSS